MNLDLSGRDVIESVSSWVCETSLTAVCAHGVLTPCLFLAAKHNEYSGHCSHGSLVSLNA